MEDILETIGEAVAQLGSVIFNAVRGWWCWVLEMMLNALYPVIVELFAFVPDTWGSYLAAFAQYGTIANGWIAVDLAMQVLAAVWAFQIAFITFKWILKLIPTVG